MTYPKIVIYPWWYSIFCLRDK